MLGLQYFGFQALWSPWFMVVMILISVGYLLLAGALRGYIKNAFPVPFRQKVFFLTAVAIYYFAQGGPLNMLAHLMFSAHMVAMVLSYLIVPPLVILGVPVWMWRPLLQVKVLSKISFLMHPILTLLLFNGLFSLYHFPQILDFVMTHFTLHRVFHYALFISAFMMWWTIISPMPGPERISSLKKMGYIFANGVLLTPACALIIFASSPLYAAFSDPLVWAKALGYCVPSNSKMILESFTGPQFFAKMPPLDDQQLGGVIMKLIQELVYGVALAYVFFQWFRKENPTDAVDPLPVK